MTLIIFSSIEYPLLEWAFKKGNLIQEGSQSLPSFALLSLPPSLSVIHKRAQPGEYRDAHFNLESMNKQWGFHVLQKFPLAAFTHTLYSRHETRVELELALRDAHMRFVGRIPTQIFGPINTDPMWDICAHAHTQSPITKFLLQR